MAAELLSGTAIKNADRLMEPAHLPITWVRNLPKRATGWRIGATACAMFG